MKLKINLFVGSLILASCAAQPPKESAQSPQTAPLVQRNYIVRDRSHSEPPLWSYDFMTYASQTQGQDRYFMGDSGDVNDRIAGCDIAKARSKREIALEMSSFITSKLNETAEGQAVINKMEGGGNTLDRKLNQALTEESVRLLSGVQLVSTTWEERDYTQAGGANSVFNCKALVKISKKTLEDVVKQTTKKAIDMAPAADKPVISKSLTDAPQEFSNASPQERL